MILTAIEIFAWLFLLGLISSNHKDEIEKFNLRIDHLQKEITNLSDHVNNLYEKLKSKNQLNGN